MTRLLSMTIASVATMAAISSCGSSPSSGASTSPPAVTLDHCLVGTWKSMNIRGTIMVGGVQATLSGGAGELVTITTAGTIRTDDTNTGPVAGTGTDGNVYTVTSSGTATGTITAAGGRIAIKLDQPTPLTVTLSRNGTVLQTQHPGPATDSYTCMAGSSLLITGAGGIVSTYAPG